MRAPSPVASAASLVGHRIRERRLDRGIRQADLAKMAGISASYLNLIEHNRRKIGGKLLQNIARILEVEAVALTQGAEAAVLDGLRAAAGRLRLEEAEVSRAEDFAGRFPGWAALVAEQDRRIVALEARVATLADRMAHDPALAAALHDIISSVTSIRSTSAILVGEEELDSDWQGRFHRNIDDDARRLAQSSTALVGYLEASPGPEGAEDAASQLSPSEEVAAFFQSGTSALQQLEIDGGTEADIAQAIESSPELRSSGARALAGDHLARVVRDAQRLPLDRLTQAMDASDADPAALARQFNVDLATVLRRIATLPTGQGDRPAGLAISDGSGALKYLKPVAGFSLPRASGSCPLWPLYRALSAPGFPIREEVVLPGTSGEKFLCYAVAGPLDVPDFGEVPIIEATMLVLPWPGGEGGPARPVGLGCQICPRTACSARREPSLIEG